MPTTIAIQRTMSYGFLPVFIMFLLVISPLIINGYKKRKLRKQEELNSTEGIKINEVPLSVKEVYSNRLTQIRNDFDAGEIDSKEGYKALSIILREFILEYAGIDVTKKTLAEIKRANLPSVAKLIEEYYAAEFAPDQNGNLSDSIMKTKRVIHNWKSSGGDSSV